MAKGTPRNLFTLAVAEGSMVGVPMMTPSAIVAVGRWVDDDLDEDDDLDADDDLADEDNTAAYTELGKRKEKSTQRTSGTEAGKTAMARDIESFALTACQTRCRPHI